MLAFLSCNTFRRSLRHFATMQKNRIITKSVVSREQAEGDGARVRRSIGTEHLRNLDPFLMLDEFFVRAPAGFPDHPHRGFETVTYMLEGKFVHEDFAGHKGEIGPGDLQWMTAGRGIVHAEMPATTHLNRGLQLWVNLPAKDKLCEPHYQEMLDNQVPRAEQEGVSIKVIAGQQLGVSAVVRTRTPIMFLDVKMEAGRSFNHTIPESYTGFVYVLEGSGSFGQDETSSDAHTTLVLGKGDGLSVKADKGTSLHYAIIAGEPIHEPIKQHGPFVMNTGEEIRQAMMDYQLARNGFERSRGWRSSIADGIV